ncbi:MAG: hypothetical protein IKT82_03865 [Bacteroidaceae bacterium]|nr:hypothetical protein [Bacteroidaceae bacterium]
MGKTYIRIVHLSFMKKVVLLIALASLLQGCRSTPTTSGQAVTPIGRWSISGDTSTTNYHGVELLQDGRARSINLITLHYENWFQRGDTLILSGRSSAEKTEQEFSDTMKILSLTDTKMILQSQGMKWELNKIPE